MKRAANAGLLLTVGLWVVILIVLVLATVVTAISEMGQAVK